MKFKVGKKYRYWWPVTIRVPDEDNPGKFAEMKLKILFEARKREEDTAALEVYRSLKTAKEVADHEHSQLLAVVKDWDEVEDDDKKQVPFSQELFLAELEHTWFRQGIFAAYNDSLHGIEARAGNSAEQPKPGQTPASAA